MLGQYEGLRSLGEARERFLDLAGLIEAAYADEARIAAVLSARDEEVVTARGERRLRRPNMSVSVLSW